MDKNEYYDLWQLSDEVDSVVTAVMGECNASIVIDNGVLVLQLDKHLDEEQVMMLCSQFYSPATYEGDGDQGAIFNIYPRETE